MVYCIIGYMFHGKIILGICSVIMMSNYKCQDEPDPAPELPAVTQSGANTFGCLVNGEVWLPKGKSSFFGSGYPVIAIDFNYYDEAKIEAPYSDSNDVAKFRLRTNNVGSGEDRIHTSFYFYKSNLFDNLKTKVFSQEKPRDSIGDGFTGYYKIERNEYFPIENSNNQLSITLIDTTNNIVSGTFSFDAAFEEDTVEIRDGRFDLAF